MDTLLKEFEDMGIKVEVVWKAKNRKKTIRDSLIKLRDSEDNVKFKYVKTLYRYYSVINSLGYIFYPKDIPVEEDKYGLHYLCSYLDGVVNSSKLIIAGVINALGNDESLDPFSKYLMFTHMYSPEQVKEIGHEEIYRREKEYERELGLV